MLWAIVIITILWIIISGFMHRQVDYQFLPAKDESFFSMAFMLALGQASVKTIYSYLGYYNVCHLGGNQRSAAQYTAQHFHFYFRYCRFIPVHER